jgi:DNA polymerase III delta subunit
MTLQELMVSIANNRAPHYLILYGKEQKILELYINQIAKNYKSVIYNDSVSDVVNLHRRKSLDKSTKLYIVDEDVSFLKAENAWSTINSEFAKSKDGLIVRYHKLDKGSKFFHNNKQNIVEFPYLSDDVLLQYINRDLPNLSEKNALSLIKYCNNDYGRILLEIDKIIQYDSHNMSITNTGNVQSKSIDTCFSELDKQGLFYKEIGDITFELTNAVLGGYTETAIQKLNEAKRKGEPAMMIASILYNGFRNLLAYQGLGKNKQEAMERTGMTKGELWGCTKNVGGYSLEEVRRNMLACQSVESGIKMGAIDEDIALEYLVLYCLK